MWPRSKPSTSSATARQTGHLAAGPVDQPGAWHQATCLASRTIYAITSLTATQARPAELAAIIRGHWLVEDRLHWVRHL